MEEYFSDDYLTFYEIKILLITNRHVSIEALVINADELELLLKDSRVKYLDSILSPTPVEEFE